MALTLLKMLEPYASSAGLLNAGEVCGLPSALAATLIAAGTAVDYDGGSGAGTPTASAQRGLGEGELASAYTAAGFTVGAQVESAAIQGYDGSVTITDGRAIPNRLLSPLDKLQA